MKLKRILAAGFSAALIGAVSLTAYAAAVGANFNGEESGGFRFPWHGKYSANLTDEQKSEIEGKMADIQSILDSALTDEQKAEFAEKREKMESKWAEKGGHWNGKESENCENWEAKRGEMKERMQFQKDKWKGLTDEQKEELYSLQDKSADAQIAIIDKYLELGVIDEETAQSMKDRLTEGKTFMRENGGMPGFGGGFKGCRGHGGRHGMFGNDANETD